MQEPDKRDAVSRVPVMLVLPRRLADATRAYASHAAQTRNVVVRQAMYEYAPRLRKEPKRCQK